MFQLDNEFTSATELDESTDADMLRTRARSISTVSSDVSDDFQSASQGRPCVRCMVCKANIDIRGSGSQYVVRCPECQEATPIRVPPDGKKYVRCICNCLLVCRGGALRVMCPRQGCRRIMETEQRGSRNLGQTGALIRIECFYCKRNFLFNTSDTNLVYCPYCKKRSAVGKGYKLRCAMVYLAVGVICVILGVTAVAYTFRMARRQMSYYLAYVFAFFVAVLFFLRSLYFFLMPVSPELGPL